MAMNVPTWGNAGVEPSAERKTNGFSAGENLPADYLNWFINQSFTNLQEAKTQLTTMSNTVTAITPILANMQKLSANMPRRIKLGRYTGTGTTQTINIGINPIAVIVGDATSQNQTYLAYINAPQRKHSNFEELWLKVVTGGFTVAGTFANESGYPYYYLAFYDYS